MERYDFCVIGGGIVGLTTAYSLMKRYPGSSLALIEKEAALGSHQTSHNSGVIHAGVYYKPGSLKAKLCREGAQATRLFCDEHDIAYETRGKLIVAADDSELGRLAALHTNAETNGLGVQRLSAEELKEREPAVAGVAGLLVPSTGIVDYSAICRKLGGLIVQAGAEIHCNQEITGIKDTNGCVELRTREQTYQARHVVACGGLQADRLARMCGVAVDFRIVPFRGEYYAASPELASTFHHLIYPVPDPKLPFLGVHFTPTVDGSLTIGPNAVLGFAREGYRKFSFNMRDMLSIVGFPGTWKMGRQHWKFGLEEFQDSILKRAYLEKCRKYWPDLKARDLQPWRAGIRAQAVTRAGDLVHDFLFANSGRTLHVCNAPSPAATSAIPIGELIADRVEAMRNAAN